MQPEKGRASLGFPDAVMSAFAFLTKNFSFRCVKRDVTFVRLESDAVFVNIYHGRASYELNVEIGESIVPENPFTIGEILWLITPENAASYRPYQVTTKEGVQKFVPELARLVMDYATPAVIGDHDFFKQLSELRTQRSQHYLKQIKLNRVRAEVETAWRQKNYRRVIELYDSMKDDLTPTEAKKLEYATKQATR
jgi:hypothetical protein